MIYHTTSDDLARFALGEKGQHTLITLGVNPSTATDRHFDPTIRKVIGFAERHGFDGWLMINIYPQRATFPGNLHNEMNRTYHKTNLKVVGILISQIPHPKIWCAWGNAIGERPYLKRCLKDFVDMVSEYAPRYYHIGALTAYGNPRHPSRLPYSLAMEEFNMKRYLHECANGN